MSRASQARSADLHAGYHQLHHLKPPQGDFWVAPAAAHPQSCASRRGASRPGVPGPWPLAPGPPRPPAPSPAGSLGAIRWRRPISSLFREVFSDGKGEKSICEPCKPIPPSWVNKGSSVGSGMPGCRSRDGIKEQPLPCPELGGRWRGPPIPCRPGSSPSHQHGGLDPTQGSKKLRWDLMK